MRTVVVDCDGIKSEAELWQRYLAASSPDGADYFGRNLCAFRDAVLAGGPGWPGECELRFCNTGQLKAIDEGLLYSALLSIAGSSKYVRMHVE